MSSALVRLISHKFVGRCRKFCSGGNRELAPSPWLMLPPSFIGGRDMVYNFYSPIKDEVVSFNGRGGKEEAELMQDDETKLVGSSHGWLALFNSRNSDIFLSNPISGRRIDLPPLAGKPFSAIEANKLCLRPVKVILSCSPDDQDCRAVMILGSAERVAFWHPGSREWTPLGEWYDDCVAIEFSNDLRFYVDFVYSAARKSFFGFLSTGMCLHEELEGWDIADPSAPTPVQLNRFARLRSNRQQRLLKLYAPYLVHDHHSNQFFLVRRHPSFVDPQINDYSVFRIIQENVGRLELCSSLDDMVMFVGLNHSLALKASRFPQLNPNSIYFCDMTPHINHDYTIEIFDYQNKTCSPLYYPSCRLCNTMPLTWFTPTF